MVRSDRLDRDNGAAQGAAGVADEGAKRVRMPRAACRGGEDHAAWFGRPAGASVPAEESESKLDGVRDAMRKLKKSGREVFVIDLAVEPFLRDGPAAVFGVLLGEGEAG